MFRRISSQQAAVVGDVSSQLGSGGDMVMHEIYTADLQSLADRGRLRTLRGRIRASISHRTTILGWLNPRNLRQAAADALARGVPIGSGGSRLLRGNHPEHEALEREAAAYFGAESALYFGGGYVANFAIFSTLPQRGDLVRA